MLFVTHDQSEALKISDRIGLLLDGNLQQLGSPEELFYHPATPEAATFFGSSNFIHGQITDGLFDSTIVCCKTDGKDTPAALAVIRPEDITLDSSPSAKNISGRVLEVFFEGTTTRVSVKVHDTVFTVLSVRPDISIGQTVWLLFPAERLHIFSQNQKTP